MTDPQLAKALNQIAENLAPGPMQTWTVVGAVTTAAFTLVLCWATLLMVRATNRATVAANAALEFNKIVQRDQYEKARRFTNVIKSILVLRMEEIATILECYAGAASNGSKATIGESAILTSTSLHKGVEDEVIASALDEEDAKEIFAIWEDVASIQKMVSKDVGLAYGVNKELVPHCAKAVERLLKLKQKFQSK